MSSPLHYALTIADIHHHLVDVTLTVPAPAGEALELTMPSWSPGSYLLREYGRHVQRFAAADADGAPLAAAKISRNTWRVDLGGARQSVTVSYRLFCHDLNVRANHVEDTHAFLNGPSVFMRVDGRADEPLTVEIRAPFEGWRIHTGLSPVDGPRTPSGAARFQAADYDELVDCPFLLGPFDPIVFEAAGTQHRLVLVGPNNAPVERLTADMARTVEATGGFFGGDIPYSDYLTIVLHSDGARGGLEHRNSTVLMFPQHGYANDEGYEDFITLFSHEHFHVWNVKRIRPDTLGPFDYANENYTRALWIMEGFTSYYENILLLRAGLMTPKRFLDLLGKRIGALQTTPGRALHALEEASFDAWIKLYRPDESTPNTTVSYYLKGEIVALALDLTLRHLTKGARSLDDLMRDLWARFKATGAGFPEADFQGYVEAIADADLDPFFTSYVRGTDEIDYDALLTPFGLRLAPAAQAAPVWLGAQTSNVGDRVVLSSVLTGSPAALAGLYAGDELVALDGFKVDRNTLKPTLDRLSPGQALTAHVFRRGQLRQADLTLTAPPPSIYTLEDVNDPSPEALQLRGAWLDHPQKP